MLNALRKLFRTGGWAPIAVLVLHLFLSRVLHAYRFWHDTDIPVHFAGGMAIAFFVSGLFRALPRKDAQRSRTVLLELVLMFSLTATAAVFWEFAEFIFDRTFGTNVQVSLANTMQDQAMGIMGALFLIAVRARQLGARVADVRELAGSLID